MSDSVDIARSSVISTLLKTNHPMTVTNLLKYIGNGNVSRTDVMRALFQMKGFGFVVRSSDEHWYFTESGRTVCEGGDVDYSQLFVEELLGRLLEKGK